MSAGTKDEFSVAIVGKSPSNTVSSQSISANVHPRRWCCRIGIGHGITQEGNLLHALRRSYGVFGGRVSLTPFSLVPTAAHSDLN